MPSCTSCGSSNIETDHARGSAVCTNCGMVLEDNIIMAEVSFMENDKGGSGVVGQFVNADGGKMFSLGSSSYHHGFGRDSKAVTLQNGKRSISSLAASLALNSSHVEAAYSYFKLAVEHKFIQGRRTESVVAACLYIECRKQQTSHMLLDFSDILQTNVYVLGAVYLKLCQKLRVRLPVVDPSLYIVRFSHRLEFNEKTHEVSMTAMRLVQRMKRDWIQVGRRPAGICGAALLIAARLHGFSRTQGEIIEVVRICNATLRRRLEEFSDTPSSELTPQVPGGGGRPAVVPERAPQEGRRGDSSLPSQRTSVLSRTLTTPVPLARMPLPLVRVLCLARHGWQQRGRLTRKTWRETWPRCRTSTMTRSMTPSWARRKSKRRSACGTR
eukprot:m.178307 g.178307  ORF g.178307 m.178307 type:complete len:384 (+) comp15360_c0_seq7:1038-2189(+)